VIWLIGIKYNIFVYYIDTICLFCLLYLLSYFIFINIVIYHMHFNRSFNVLIDLSVP
jgi:hypothetical protein